MVHDNAINSRMQIPESYEAINNDENSMLFVSCPNWGVNPNNYGAYDLCPHASSTNDNGNLQSYQEMQGGPGYPSFGTFTELFSYDGLNRLTSAQDSSGGTTNWARTFNYDTWGNVWASNVSGPLAGNTPTSNIYSSTTNRDTRWSYDAAGNLLNVNGNTAAYNAENQMTSLAGTGLSETFRYDGLGQRVQKTINGTTTTTYVYDAFGLAAEYVNGNWSRDYILDGGGTMYATENASGPCTTCYFGFDHLGSIRLVMDQNANVIARHDYLPYGEEVSGTAGRTTTGFGVNDNVTEKFTGQIRDSESGQDYFNARYFTPALGRFNSVDPENAGANLLSSQSWNGYGYVSGNPMNSTDPSGMDTIQPVLCPSCTITVNGGYIDVVDTFGYQTYCALNPMCSGLFTDPTFYGSVTEALPKSGPSSTPPPPAAPSPTHTNTFVPPNNGIKTLNCAGYTASRSIFAQTKAQTIEFGGFIEKASNGTYSYTPPFAGNRTSLPSFYDQYNSLVQSLSKGVSVAGWYHSHPVPPPTYPSAEAFSGQDLSVSHYLNAPGFVVTPSGAVLRLNPGPPAVTTRVPPNVCQSGG